MEHIQDFSGFINESAEKTLNEANVKSRLDTKGFIEPEEMKVVLSQIYLILSGNVRDYISIDGIEDTIEDLRKYRNEYRNAQSKSN